LAKLRAKWLTVSYTPFALHFCPQRCRSRQISWITCELQTETVIKRCYVNRQRGLIIKKYQTAVDQFWLTHWQTDAVSDWLTAHVQNFATAAFLCCGSCVQWVVGFLYGRCKQLFVSELNNAYFSWHLFLKQCLSGYVLHNSLLHLLLIGMAIFWTQIFYKGV